MWTRRAWGVLGGVAAAATVGAAGCTGPIEPGEPYDCTPQPAQTWTVRTAGTVTYSPHYVGYVENATGELTTDSCTGYLFGQEITREKIGDLTIAPDGSFEVEFVADCERKGAYGGRDGRPYYLEVTASARPVTAADSAATVYGRIQVRGFVALDAPSCLGGEWDPTIVLRR